MATIANCQLIVNQTVMSKTQVEIAVARAAEDLRAVQFVPSRLTLY
jgi:hypothetical protein